MLQQDADTIAAACSRIDSVQLLSQEFAS